MRFRIQKLLTNLQLEVMGWIRPLKSSLAFHRGQLKLPPSLYMTYKLKRKEAGPMKDITTIGIDLAKNVFQLHGINSKGATVLRKRLSRRNVLPFFARSPLTGKIYQK
jgi:hypothetical protein